MSPLSKRGTRTIRRTRPKVYQIMRSNCMAVYLLHFIPPYKHARHYLGYAVDVDARNIRHEAGNGARLCQVQREAGGSWVVARVWFGGDRSLERELKRWNNGCRLCPICKRSAREEVIECFSSLQH